MRRRFGKIINELAKKDKKIVLLVGDIGYGIFDDFRKNHPNRFFNLGICEQSLVGTAAGMALEGLKPYLSHHFNLTVELPLKVIVRGFTYEILPNRWVNRKAGESKLKIKEMGSRYWFIILYCLIEKLLSVGDYKK